MGNTYNLSTVASAYGPKFNSKCLLGIRHMKYKGDNTFDYYFWSSALGTYETYKENQGQSMVNAGNVFCFGAGT